MRANALRRDLFTFARARAAPARHSIVSVISMRHVIRRVERISHCSDSAANFARLERIAVFVLFLLLLCDHTFNQRRRCRRASNCCASGDMLIRRSNTEYDHIPDVIRDFGVTR